MPSLSVARTIFARPSLVNSTAGSPARNRCNDRRQSSEWLLVGAASDGDEIHHAERLYELLRVQKLHGITKEKMSWKQYSKKSLCT